MTHKIHHHTLDLHFPPISSEDLKPNRIRVSHTPIDLENGIGWVFSGVTDFEMEKKIENTVIKPGYTLKISGTTLSTCHTLKPAIAI